ncbi:MAG: transposase, partial [Acidobacteria bacterium]
MAALATKRSRVYLTSEQAAAAARQFGCARFVYNHLLAFSQSRYSNK